MSKNLGIGAMIGGIYFKKKWRAETLQRGLDFDNIKPRLPRGECTRQYFWTTLYIFSLDKMMTTMSDLLLHMLS